MYTRYVHVFECVYTHMSECPWRAEEAIKWLELEFQGVLQVQRETLPEKLRWRTRKDDT